MHNSYKLGKRKLPDLTTCMYITTVSHHPFITIDNREGCCEESLENLKNYVAAF